jgi:hypothetical protein
MSHNFDNVYTAHSENLSKNSDELPDLVSILRTHFQDFKEEAKNVF